MERDTDKAERFIKMCTSLPFEEVKDERDEGSVPELLHVAELRDAGSTQDAIEYANSLMKMYPDNDLIPFMVAYIYYQKQFPREAMQTAVAAIRKCPRKYRLYSVAGLAEFDQDHIPEAIVWWCRSVIAQCTILDFQEHDPFLYLAHMAEVLGSKREATAFFTMTDSIDPKRPRLDLEEVERLSSIKSSWAQAPLVKVLRHIEANYLHS
ncbi:MAG: hypothetical protein JXB07_10245 [Anaerolineae bacterium]|nr:hypothetical protein [Anaerolineae bacterium]